MVWKDVKGYEGIYSVSDTGIIKSNDREIEINEFERTVKGHIRKQFCDKNGYCVVDLYKGNERKKCKVHRIVMEAFKPNKNACKLDVNHIDGNKKNNNLLNLEWCTRKENINHAVKSGLTSQNIGLIARKDGNEYISSSIYGMYDVLKEFEDIKCKRKTFGGNILRAIETDGIYYGYKFEKVVVQ
jgi:hypothetical protein